MAKNNEVTEATEVVAAPKRKRTVKAKETKTGLQILATITVLQDEVRGLNEEVAKLDPSSVLYPIVNDVAVAKTNELNKALETVYTI